MGRYKISQMQRQRTPNVAHFVSKNARRWPRRLAVVDGAVTWTWGALDARIGALAAGLSSLGVARGEAVMIVSPNCAELVETMFAVLRLGATIVPTNFRLTPHDLAQLAAICRPSAIVARANFEDHAAAVAPELHASRAVVSIGAADWAPQSTDDLMARHRETPFSAPPCFRGDPAWLFFTSGSSGRPKAAVLTHDHLAFVATNYLLDLLPGCSECDVSLVVAPLSHGAGTHLITQVAAGATSVICCPEHFRAAEVWQAVERFGVTNLFLVPTMLKLLVEDPSVDAHDHSSLRQVLYAGAPAYRHDQQLARRKLGEVLVQFYGMAEVTSCITKLPADQHGYRGSAEIPFGTCGTARTGMEISIQDEGGRILPPGASGEVCVCGPGVFAGYLDDDAANQAAFRDGWFRTGDLGFLDEAGYLFLTGRASDMYISGGSNIDPRELEEKILDHPLVTEVAVVGVPDQMWGEIGVAICVPADGAQIGEDDLLDWMRERIARYKVPKRVLVWETLPRSGYGKVTKKLLRQTMRERGELA